MKQFFGIIKGIGVFLIAIAFRVIIGDIYKSAIGVEISAAVDNLFGLGLSLLVASLILKDLSIMKQVKKTKIK